MDELYEMDEWEQMVETGEEIISAAACMFNVYSFLQDYYIDEDKIEKAEKVSAIANRDIIYISEKIKDKSMDWEFKENRPFLNFLYRLAMIALETGNDYEIFLFFFEKLLRLNPLDHHGVRGIIPKVYFAMKEYNTALDFLG